MIALTTHRRETATLHDTPDSGAAIAAFAGQSAALALDCLQQGVFVLDADTRIHLANAAAKLLIETDRMCIRNGLLCSPAASETTTLRRIVRERIEAASFGRTQMIYQRLDAADDALCLGVTASCQPPGLRLGPPVAIVLVTKPSQISLPDVQQLRDHFCLTEAQARLALEVTKGHGLKACARRLGIAVTTARSHLQQIFAKTDTKRQAEFVRLAYACQFRVRATCDA